MSELDQFIVPLVKCPQGAGLHDTRSITCPYCELTKLRVALDESIKVIQFYGDKSNYAGRRSKSDIFSNVVGDNTIYPDRTATGGRRAREFLSKHKELIKGEA
jgi:hypothetical protein